MNNNSLPIYSGSVDHLRHGFRSLEHETSLNHPMQKNQSNIWMSKIDMVRRTHGSHLAMKLATEKEIFSHFRRLPGLESSSIALETMLGTDESMDFADYLNDPSTRPDIPKFSVHSTMEVKLGIM